MIPRYTFFDVFETLVVMLVTTFFMACFAICSNICDAKLPGDCWSSFVNADALGSSRGSHSDFTVGGTCPPPMGGTHGGGQRLDGGGFMRDSRQDYRIPK